MGRSATQELTQLTAQTQPLNLEAARPSDSAARHRFKTLALSAVVVLVLTGLQLVRQAGIPSWRTVWAEDGTVFLKGSGNLRSIFTSYAGYEHLLPRLLALGTIPLPATQLARYFALVGSLVTALLSVSLYWLSRQLIPSRILRGVLVLAVALLPAALGENLASVVNINWPLIFVGYWALLLVPLDTRDVLLAGTIAFVAASSNALTLSYLPLAALLLYKRRDRRSRIVLAAYAAGVALQTTIVLTATSSSPTGQSKVSELPLLYSVRVFGSMLLGEKWIRSLWLTTGLFVAFVSALLVLAGLVYLMIRAAGASRCLGGITVCYSVFLFCYPVYERGTAALHLTDDTFSFAGARFATLSILLLLSGTMILLSGARIGAAAKQIAIVLVAAQFVVVGVVGFRATNARSAGPEWILALAGSRLACTTKPKHLVPVALSPTGWYTLLPCARIDR
jgi:hypothetical protein